MQSLLQSAFLQALGYAIFNSLWQVALLWLVVMLINGAGNLSSSKKYFVSVTAQFAGFVWFLFTLQFYYRQCDNAITNIQSANLLNNGYYFYEPVVDNFSSGLTYIIIKTEQLLPYLSVAYLLMLMFLCVRVTRALLHIKHIKTQGLSKPNVEWKLFVKKTAAYLGIRKEVALYFSDLVKSPLTIGFLKPIILLPVASVNHLSAEQVEAILLHELAHIRRADYLINILLCIIETVLFFNPFTHLLGKFIKRERENSCDDWVLQFQYKPAMYAEALLRIATLQAQPVFAMQATTKKQELLPRVKRMLNQKEKNYQYRNHIFALLLITIVLTTVAWFNPSSPRIVADTTSLAPKKIMVEPFTANVENPFYNPFYYFFDNNIKSKIKEAINNTDVIEAIPRSAELVDKVTPVAIESVKSAYSNLENELPGIQNEIENSLKEVSSELVNLNIDGKAFTDSIIRINFKDEIAKIDWASINNDLKKAKLDITNILNLKTEQGKIQLNDFVKQLTIQLSTLDEKKVMKELEKDQRKIQVELEKKLLEQKRRKVQQTATTKRSLSVWSDIARDDLTTYGVEDSAIYNVFKGYDATAQSNANVSSNFTTAASFAPTMPNFNSMVNTNRVESAMADSIKVPDSAVILIQNDPANNNSHSKQIVIKIFGNNGIVKTYTLNAEVYQ